MARARSSAPIWARPEPGARRPRHTREQIAAAALRLADEEGIDAVSMRRVAAALGAGTMTLYHYVPTKDDLFALMDDAIMAEVLVPADELPADWRGALRMIAMRSHAAFDNHPWAIHGMRGTRPGPNGMRHFEQSLTAVSSLDVTSAERMNVIAIVDDYVFGHVVRELDHRFGRDRDEAEYAEGFASFTAYVEQQLATGEFPQLAAMVEDDDLAGTWSRLARSPLLARRFEIGLELLLDGIQADLEARGAIRAGRRARRRAR